MKKQLAVLAATAVLGVTSAFAANPFSDVTPQDWAYQAVAQLASQGIVNGYPDGTFKGQSNITRYEMAQMVAKAIVRQDRVDAEQNAIINRLANEFSAELNNLGVRVSTLENKVGNFKFTGDARLKYEAENNDGRNSKFDYRGRVKFEAAVNENTKAVIRLAGEKEFGKNARTKTEVDRVYVQHNFGKYATVTAGRTDLFIGSGLTFDDAFEGVIANVGTDKLNAVVAHGYKDYNKDIKKTEKPTEKSITDVPYEFTTYQLNFMPTAKVAVKGYYRDNHELVGADYHGVALDVNVTDKVWVGGEYARTEQQGAKGEAWIAGVGYGEAEMAKAGTWGVKAQYFNAKEKSPVGNTTWNFVEAGKKGVLATVDYTLAKNVGLSAYASIDTKDQANKAQAESYRAELNYKF